jgi:hypothetical protein
MIYIYIRVYHIYWHIYCICNPVKTTLVVVRKKPVLRLYEIVFLKWRIPKTVGFNTDMIQYWMIWGPPGSRNTPSSAFAFFLRHFDMWRTDTRFESHRRLSTVYRMQATLKEACHPPMRPIKVWNPETNTVAGTFWESNLSLVNPW